MGRTTFKNKSGSQVSRVPQPASRAEEKEQNSHSRAETADGLSLAEPKAAFAAPTAMLLSAHSVHAHNTPAHTQHTPACTVTLSRFSMTISSAQRGPGEVSRSPSPCHALACGDRAGGRVDRSNPTWASCYSFLPCQLPPSRRFRSCNSSRCFRRSHLAKMHKLRSQCRDLHFLHQCIFLNSRRLRSLTEDGR